MSESDNPPRAASELRSTQREALEVPVLIEFDAQRLDARSENVSEAGALVVAQDSIRVRIRVGDDAERTGRLVRLQALGGDRVGLAIEFDS